MTNQNESKLPTSDQAQEAAKALVATDVAITEKAVLRLRNRLERAEALPFCCQIQLPDENRKAVGEVADGQSWSSDLAKFELLKLASPAETRCDRPLFCKTGHQPGYFGLSFD